MKDLYPGVRRWQLAIAPILVAIGALAATSTAQADDPPSAEQEALADGLIQEIEAANADPDDAAEIVLEEDTLYLLTTSYDGSDNGLPVIDSEITIVGNGSTIYRSYEAETAEFRILEISSAGDLTLENIRVVNGAIAAPGGGVLNHGHLNVLDSEFFQNRTLPDPTVAGPNGGAIYSSEDAQLALVGTDILSNDSSGHGGAIYFSGGESSQLEIDDGWIGHNEASGDGGALYGTGDMAIDDSWFFQNTATAGGGVVAGFSGSDVTIESTNFSSNWATENGAGLFVPPSGELAIHGGVLEHNSAENQGGGIYSSQNSALSVDSAEFVGNDAGTQGGAIYFQGGTFSMVRGTVDRNNAGTHGGGLGFGANTVGAISESTIHDNEADSSSGGISVFGSSGESATMTITNSTISDNNTVGHGGGVRAGMWASVKLINNTITGNVAGELGGGVTISPGDPNGPGSLEITNTIVAGNFATEEETNDIRPGSTDQLTDGGNNLIGDGGGIEDAIVDGENGNLVGDPEDPIDPLLGPLDDNGGPTQTHALLDGSPAIESGNDANAPQTDQRGVNRPQGDQSDIGAYEREFDEPEPEPDEQVSNLIVQVEDLDLQRGNQLTNALDSALHHLAGDRERQACTAIDRFAAHAERQTMQPRGLSDDEAALLVEDAELIRDGIGC